MPDRLLHWNPEVELALCREVVRAVRRNDDAAAAEAMRQLDEAVDAALLERLSRPDIAGPVLYHTVAVDLGLDMAHVRERIERLALRGLVTRDGPQNARVALAHPARPERRRP